MVKAALQVCTQSVPGLSALLLSRASHMVGIWQPLLEVPTAGQAWT